VRLDPQTTHFWPHRNLDVLRYIGELRWEARLAIHQRVFWGREMIEAAEGIRLHTNPGSRSDSGFAGVERRITLERREAMWLA